MSDVPVWTWIVIAAGFAGLTGTVVAAIRPERRIAAGIGLGVWTAAVVTLAATDVLPQAIGGRVPWIGPVLLTAVLLGLLLLNLAGVDPVTLTRSQAFRAVGGIFVVLFLLGYLPPQFALPAGIGDVVVGVSAPFVARRLARGDTRGVRRFHLLGILDLVVAVTMGVLSAPGPLGVFSQPISTAPLMALPLVLVPAALVPLSIAVHVTVLRRLVSGRQISEATRV